MRAEGQIGLVRLFLSVASAGVLGTTLHTLRVALIVSTVSLFAATYLDKAFARFDEASEQVIRGDFGDPKRE